MIRFTCKGDPIAQGSKNPKGKYVEDADPRLHAWRNAIGFQAGVASSDHRKVDYTYQRKVLGKPRKLTRRVCYDEAIYVWAWFWIRDPAGGYRRELQPDESSPDLDKLYRAVGDALEAANIVSNDARILGWPAVPGKRYASEKGGPGVEILVASATEVHDAWSHINPDFVYWTIEERIELYGVPLPKLHTLSNASLPKEPDHD